MVISHSIQAYVVLTIHFRILDRDHVRIIFHFIVSYRKKWHIMKLQDFMY